MISFSAYAISFTKIRNCSQPIVEILVFNMKELDENTHNYNRLHIKHKPLTEGLYLKLHLRYIMGFIG